MPAEREATSLTSKRRKGLDLPTSHRAHVIPRLGSPQLMLVVNAHASGARGELVAGVESELRRSGAGFATLVTESPVEWIDAVGDDPERRVVLVGGDGTLHAAVDARDVRAEIALVPAGRANNVARSLGIPLAPRAATQLAVQGIVRPIDLIEARTPTRTKVTVEAVSIGFLAEARTHYHGDNSAHLASGLVAGVQALAQFRPLHVRIGLRGSTVELAVTQLFVANLPLFGFGLHVAPKADPNDQLLDVLAVEARSRIAIPALIGRLRRDGGIDGPDVHHWLAERVRIEALEDSPVIADSTDLGPGPLEARVLTNDLRIVRP
jgi:diacylglycerol kinase (ATP)